MKKQDKDAFKAAIDSSKNVGKQIDSLIALYIGKEDDRQGITSDTVVNVMDRIGTAQWYSGSRPAGMTPTENRLLQQAKDALQTALQQTNEFYLKEWPEYRALIEEQEFETFKETKQFGLD